MINDDVTKVAPAIDTSAVVESYCALTVQNNFMFMRRKNVGILHPTDLPDFTVTAVELQHALKNLGPCDVVVTDKTVTLKAGGRQIRLKQLKAPSIPAKPEIETTPVPDDLADRVNDILPFASCGHEERPWTFGARIDGDLLTATNAVVIAQARLSSSSNLSGVSIPLPVLQQISKRADELVSWGINDRAVMLEFKDGGWLMASRPSSEMPDHIPGILDACTTPTFAITPEYRASFLSAVDFSEDVLAVHADHIHGTRLSAEHKCWLDTPVQEAPALFTASDLTNVLKVASHIDFTTYPNPCSFVTASGTKGLIAGRSS